MAANTIPDNVTLYSKLSRESVVNAKLREGKETGSVTMYTV